MKVSEVSQSIVGRRVKGVFTAAPVTGVIDKIQETEYTIEVHIVLDKPIQWGDDQYTSYWSTARKEDGFGNLEHTELLPDFSCLEDYKPKNEHFTSQEEIDMLTEKLGLDKMSNEELQQTRDEVVRFFHYRILDAIKAEDSNKRWDLSQSMMSVTAVIDYCKVNKGMEV